MKVGQVLWSALQCAKMDRQSFVDAWRGDTSESCVREALQEIEEFDKLQILLFGTNRSQLQKKIEKMKVQSVLTLMKEDEIFDTSGGQVE